MGLKDLFGKIVDRVTRPSDRPPARPSAPPIPTPPAPPSDEPILTRTMAGLLASQGHEERALRIYDHLVARHPEDGALASEAAEVRQRVTARGRPSDEVAAVAVRGEALLVSWNVTEASVNRSRGLLDGEGELVTRTVIVTPDERTGIRTEIRDEGPVEATGEWLVSPLPSGARCTAAVGLRSGDRFVSVAHAPVVTL